MITLIKIEKIGLLAIALAFLFSCEENHDAQSQLKSPQSSTWGNSSSGIDIPIQELFSLPGLVYFEDLKGSKYALSEGHFVCSSDFPDAIFNRATLINMQEYEGHIEDNNGFSIFFNDGIVFLEANEEEYNNYAASDIDCDLFISEIKKPCIDDEGRDAFRWCTSVAFVCFSHAFGFSYSVDENCFACGGDINKPEIKIEPFCL